MPSKRTRLLFARDVESAVVRAVLETAVEDLFATDAVVAAVVDVLKEKVVDAFVDRVQRNVRSDRDLNRACGQNHADRQQIEQRKGVFHAAILPHPAQLSIPH